MTEPGSAGSERGGTSRWRMTRNRRATAAEMDRGSALTGFDRMTDAARSCHVPGDGCWWPGVARVPRQPGCDGGRGGGRRCGHVVGGRAALRVKASDGRQPSIAFFLRASYSGTVIAPESLSWLSFSIWSAGVTPAAAFWAASAWVIIWTSWAVTFGREMM